MGSMERSGGNRKGKEWIKGREVKTREAETMVRKIKEERASKACAFNWHSTMRILDVLTERTA